MDPSFWSRHWSDADSDVASAFRRFTADDVRPLAVALGIEDPLVTDYESLENRVYGVGRLDQPGDVIKLYRPGRWSR
ncbi:MAG: hypothetical protein AAF211_26925, partial [Myxococcota bacterium]